MTRDQLIKKIALCDKKRKELAKLEQELSRECAEYGRTNGVYGFRPDHLRMQMN